MPPFSIGKLNTDYVRNCNTPDITGWTKVADSSNGAFSSGRGENDTRGWKEISLYNEGQLHDFKISAGSTDYDGNSTIEDDKCIMDTCIATGVSFPLGSLRLFVCVY